MQQKGERENMTNGECCRYIRTYSELEGLEVLEDVHQPYQLLDTSKNAINIAEEPVFCGICRF